MSVEKDFFDKQVGAIKVISAIYKYLQNNAAALDSTALLRAEYVLIISAFDSYLHNVVRKKLSNNFLAGELSGCDIKLSLESFSIINSATNINEKKQLLDLEIRKALEKDSYQSPKSVDYAMDAIGIKKIWKKSESIFNDTGEHIKDQLSLIIKRRNQIAHESDIDFLSGELRTIDSQTVDECRNFITKLVTSIDLQINRS